MGVRVPSMFSPERYPLGLITNILGGPGMNSRLNVALRERRGLVYSVDAGLTGWTDCGLFTVYFGCDPEDARGAPTSCAASSCECLSSRLRHASCRRPVSSISGNSS